VEKDTAAERARLSEAMRAGQNKRLLLARAEGESEPGYGFAKGWGGRLITPWLRKIFKKFLSDSISGLHNL
jgi:hypothetical protein